jgi:hypothetical protein
MSVLQTALAYANKGIRVVPIKQGEKRPPMQGWQNAATSDPTTIRTWFEGQFKDCGLGIATGEFRNRYLIVIDIDDREQFSGSDTLADLEELNGKLPETVEVITGSGGRHIYFLTDATDPQRSIRPTRTRHRCPWHRRTSPRTTNSSSERQDL